MPLLLVLPRTSKFSIERLDKRMAQSDLQAGNSTWKTLYRLGGIAALLAVFVFRRNLGAELMALRGLGLFSVPAMPVSVSGWFALLQ